MGVDPVVFLKRSLDPRMKNLLLIINLLNIIVIILSFNHWFAFLFRRWMIYSYLVIFFGATFFSAGESFIFIPLMGDSLSFCLEIEDLIGIEGL